MNTIQLQAERDAAQALRGYEVSEIADLPVDATSIAEYYGADVFTDDLDRDNLSGFVMIYPTRGSAEITLNATQALVRRRFTCAHELGHFWQAVKSEEPEPWASRREVGFVDDEETVVLEHRDELAAQGRSPKEIYANAFAAALLMPAHLVEQLYAAGSDVVSMARAFKVSQQAMQYRLQNLDLV